ncbi:hypothetical protein H1R20_g15906, partial [Candolleomyces eurysporus]
MSKPHLITRREALTKKTRAIAHTEQITFAQALTETAYLYDEAGKSGSPLVLGPRSVGGSTRAKCLADRGGDVRIHRGKFHHQNPKETGVCDADSVADENGSYNLPFYLEPARRSTKPMVIDSLADVKIKVAKPKGIRKEYDWVESVAPVLAIDDDLRSVFSEEEWVEIYEAERQQIILKTPYATVASSSRTS